MKVAVLVPKFPNPMQTYVLNHVTFLKKNGLLSKVIANFGCSPDECPKQVCDYDLIAHVIHINPDGSRKFLGELAKSISLFCENAHLRDRAALFFKKTKIKGSHEIKRFLKSLALLRIFFKSEFDIAHSHSLYSSYEFLFLREQFEIPLITTFHGLSPVGVKELPNERMRRVFQVGDLFLVNGNFSRSQLVKLGCPEKKIRILPQGIDLEKFFFEPRSIQSDKLILMSVGRLSQEKGFNYAVEAVAKLLNQLDFEYRIIGEGPEQARLKKLARDSNLSQHIRFLGFMNHDSLVHQFREAHILLVPSITAMNRCAETQGLVVQEAQAMGIPVIATRAGAIPEFIIDGRTGLLVEEKKPIEMAEKVVYLYNHTEKYTEISVAGRKYVEEFFDTRKIEEKLINYYRELLN